MNEVAIKERFGSVEKWQTEVNLFINQLKAEPSKEETKINEFADNSKFVPIGTVEEKLDYYFFGLWKTNDFKWSIVVNEVVCSLQLHVFHPTAQIWLERTGAGAAQIQLRAQYKVENGNRVKIPTDVLDVSMKIVNTAQKDFPHAKAEAVKNAAKSLGNIFGRNLNRDEKHNVEILTEEDAEIQIGSIESKTELNQFYNSLPQVMRSSASIKKALKKQETFLKNGQK